MEEIHLLIIWSKALNKKEQILNDLSQKFNILQIYNITWSDEKFSENLSRFYGENLPKGSHKEKHCGKDTFTCIIVKDTNPIYDSRPTSKGNRVVNKNLFDIKQVYRNWTGGGHKIHATDNIQETKIQLALLFGESYDYFLKEITWSDIDINYSNDLIGANGWKTFDELFNILNLTSNYVVLRNFDNLEDQLNSKHPDVDILVENQDLVIQILNAKKTSTEKYRVQYNVKIDSKDINFDIRFVGDNYYDLFWEKDILETKVLSKRNFYIPNNTNHFYSLIYHTLIHKKFVSDDYNKKFIQLSTRINLNFKYYDLVDYKLLNILDAFMYKYKYKFVEPKDISVFYNRNFLKNKILVEITDERYKKYYKVQIRTIIKKNIFNFLYKINLIRKKFFKGT